MRRSLVALATTLMLIVGVAVLGPASPAAAHEPSGAIFTTLADGSEVNFNIYPNKEAVYLDGGPPAPPGSAGCSASG